MDGSHAAWLVIGGYSHEAVIIFFVLSGLVIAHTTASGPGALQHYVVARTARIYSVVLPAITLSFAVKGSVALFDPTIAAEFLAKDWRWQNLVSSVLFLNESWGSTAEVPWNNPFWSLCYEAWYYVIFGVAVFADGWRRSVLLLLTMLVAGPGIMLLMPVWLLGVGLARHGHRLIPGRIGAALMFAVGAAGVIFINRSGLPNLVQHALYLEVPGFWRLQSSQRFLTDYLTGIFVAINFIGIRGLSGIRLPACPLAVKSVRWLSGYTFSLYLFHRPFTKLIGTTFPNVSSSRPVAIASIVAVALACIAVGAQTEARRREARALVRKLFFLGRRPAG